MSAGRLESGGAEATGAATVKPARTRKGRHPQNALHRYMVTRTCDGPMNVAVDISRRARHDTGMVKRACRDSCDGWSYVRR